MQKLDGQTTKKRTDFSRRTNNLTASKTCAKNTTPQASLPPEGGRGGQAMARCVHAYIRKVQAALLFRRGREGGVRVGVGLYLYYSWRRKHAL